MKTQQHVVASYDEELAQLDRTVDEMGSLSAVQIEAAMRVLSGRDAELAQVVLERDQTIDAMERDLDRFAVRVLALRQPMADDLRNILAALKIATDLERIADYAVNVAKRAMEVRNHVPRPAIGKIQQMGEVLLGMLRDAQAAYRERDTELAAEVWRRDDQVDRLYIELLHLLRTRMVEDPNSVQSGSHLLFVCKNFERIGDHLTNVCEHIYFLVSGEVSHDFSSESDATSREDGTET